LGNAAENEYESIVVGAAGVVMAADIKIGNFEPQIQVDVVLLAPLECVIILAP